MGNRKKCALQNEMKEGFSEENICKKNGFWNGMDEGKIKYVVYIKKKRKL